MRSTSPIATIAASRAASLKKAAALHEHGQPAGDCIDCLQCVHVCPTGVDIRDGPNLGCIQCGLCIDACDAVMAKIGRPARLIAYDTDINIKRRLQGQQPFYRILRSRTVLYAVIIALVGAVMLYTLATRRHEAVSVLHDRNPMFVRLSDGAVRNAYTVRILNKTPRNAKFCPENIGPCRSRRRGHRQRRAPRQRSGDRRRAGSEPRGARAGHRRTRRLGPDASLPLIFHHRRRDGGGTSASAADHFLGP